MTREEFIKELDKKSYSYEIEGDKIVVTHKVNVLLSSLTSLPPGVDFNNEGSVNLRSLTSLPPGVEFNNEGGVSLRSLTSLPSDVVFNNKGNVSLESIIGCWFDDWKGNIKGVDSTRLLNLMIKQGVFER
jgi:hypothetical protein